MGYRFIIYMERNKFITLIVIKNRNFYLKFDWSPKVHLVTAKTFYTNRKSEWLNLYYFKTLFPRKKIKLTVSLINLKKLNNLTYFSKNWLN